MPPFSTRQFHNISYANCFGIHLPQPKRKEVFGSVGVTNIRTFVDPSDPTRVAVLMDVPDMEVLAKVMQSSAAADAMAYDGVVPESLVILVEA
jgi:hypothetical protein